MTFADVSHVQLTNAPLAADQMGFETLGDKIYFVCGRATDNHSQKVYAYDPATDEWAEKADYPIAVQSICLRAVGGKLYGIGGYNSQTDTFYQDVYEYDPGENTWTQKTDMPTAREDMGSAVIGTKIYVFGGLIENVSLTHAPTKIMEVYDTSNDTWDETKADMPDYKHFGDFGCVLDGEIYAVAGSNSFKNYPSITVQQAVYKYDPVADEWSYVSYLPNPASYKELAVLNGKIYCVSGVTTSTTTYTIFVYEYDPDGDTWTQVADAPYAARGTGLAVYNGAIYMVGGFNSVMLNYLYRLGY